MSNENNEIPERIDYKGKDINTKLDIDAGALHGCNIVEGGDVTITNQVSVVQDCKVQKGGILRVMEGMAVDLIVEDGGTLILGNSCIWYHVYAQSGSEIHARSTDNIIADPGSSIHLPDKEEQEHDPISSMVDHELDAEEARINEEGHCEHCDAEADSCNFCEHKDELEHLKEQERLNDLLKADAESDQFRGGGKDPDRFGLADDNNRACLCLKVKCDESVLNHIVYFGFEFEGRSITIDSADCDEYFESDKDGCTYVYVKHLPRMLIEDDDLVLTDIVFDDFASDDDRLGIISASYENHSIKINLDEAHDSHIYDCTAENENLPEIKILGEIFGTPTATWNQGKLVIRHNKQDYIVEDNIDERESSISFGNMTYTMLIHPKYFRCAAPSTEEIHDFYEICAILGDFKVVDFIEMDPEAILSVNDVVIGGEHVDIRILWQELTIEIAGYAVGRFDIWDSITVLTGPNYDTPVRVVDCPDNRLIYRDATTNYFKVTMYPRCIVKDNIIVGSEMANTLVGCILSSMELDDDVVDEHIEITTFSVNRVLHAVQFNDDNEHYRLFKYKPEEESQNEIVEKTKQEKPSNGKLVVCGKYKYCVPVLKITLTVLDGTTKRTFVMENANGIITYAEDGTAYIAYENAVFRDDLNGTISDPSELIDGYKFTIEQFSKSLGRFVPDSLLWGGKLYYKFES